MTAQSASSPDHVPPRGPSHDDDPALRAGLADVVFGPDGLVPVVAQEHETGDVLMLAWMNAETLRRTLETGVMTYWSRSRGRVWIKGETSGHTQRVVSVHLDCDGDALLFRVEQAGGVACHTGRRTCFHRALEPSVPAPAPEGPGVAAPRATEPRG